MDHKLADGFDRLSKKNKFAVLIGIIACCSIPIVITAIFATKYKISDDSYKECNLISMYIQNSCYRHYTFFLNETEQTFSTEFETKCQAYDMYSYGTQYWCKIRNNYLRIYESEQFKSALPEYILIIITVLGSFLGIALLAVICVMIGQIIESYCCFRENRENNKTNKTYDNFTKNPKKYRSVRYPITLNDVIKV